MIVIEGLDNSGKSTLAVSLANSLNRYVQESEGPPLSEEEINSRVDKYYNLKDTVFVRHPCVSNPIYDMVRETPVPVTPGRIDLFYEQRPLFIYCDSGDRGLADHVVKDTDTPEHLELVTRGYKALLSHYREWAAQRAHLIYRIGDDFDGLIDTAIFMEARLGDN